MNTWTDAETRELVALWPKASAAQIAGRLKRSRSAVCRKAQRLRQDGMLPHGVIKHFEVVPLKGRPRRHRIMPRLDMQPCLLLELDDQRCYWPLGRIGEITTLFCGGDVAPGQRCCRHHLRIASRN